MHIWAHAYTHARCMHYVYMHVHPTPHIHTHPQPMCTCTRARGQLTPKPSVHVSLLLSGNCSDFCLQVILHGLVFPGPRLSTATCVLLTAALQLSPTVPTPTPATLMDIPSLETGGPPKTRKSPGLPLAYLNFLTHFGASSWPQCEFDVFKITTIKGKNSCPAAYPHGPTHVISAPFHTGHTPVHR